MKVKILESIAGPDFSYAPGTVLELDDTLAGKWCVSGVCKAVVVPVADEPKPKTKKA